MKPEKNSFPQHKHRGHFAKDPLAIAKKIDKFPPILRLKTKYEDNDRKLTKAVRRILLTQDARLLHSFTSDKALLRLVMVILSSVPSD